MSPDEDTVLLPPEGDRPLPSPTASATGQHCASCGATLAPDQRYCVECGQRRGPTKPPFLQSPQPQASGSAPPPRKGPRISPNAALIAGIGTLMLAMATGVLIGRTSAPSSKNAPVEYVTGAPNTGTTGTGGAGTTGTGTTGSGTSSATEGSSSTKSSSSTAGKGSTKSGSTTASKVLGSKAPSKSVVTTGSAGKGPGYQKGKFTGKFFGGSSSKKQEEEEETGEEGGGESSRKGKK